MKNLESCLCFSNVERPAGLWEPSGGVRWLTGCLAYSQDARFVFGCGPAGEEWHQCMFDSDMWEYKRKRWWLFLTALICYVKRDSCISAASHTVKSDMGMCFSVCDDTTAVHMTYLPHRKYHLRRASVILHSDVTAAKSPPCKMYIHIW